MLALESLQIPQTVGPTFLRALEHWYGAEGVARHSAEFASPVRLHTSVMHGNFPAGTYRAHQRVTWVRDPARRLVALYIQMRHQPVPVGETRTADLRQRLLAGAMTFDEFIHHPQIINGMSRWFNGLLLEDFDFVGIHEEFDRELVRCAQTLHRPELPDLQLGDDGAVAPEYASIAASIHDETLAYVRELNPACTDLYLRARDRAEREWLELGGIQVTSSPRAVPPVPVPAPLPTGGIPVTQG